jgi:4-amino-4-deoxy-L-arabinose transferase-like glycosyltransferase
MTDHRRPALVSPNRRLFLLLLTLAAFGWRIAALDFQSLWRDEVDAIYFAVRDLGETLSMIWRAGQNGPLYFLSLRPWFGLVGASEFALRFPSTAFSTLSVLLTYFVAARLLPGHMPPSVPGLPQPDPASEPTAVPPPRACSPVVPWLAALLMAANPYQVWYAQKGKMYAAVTLLTLVASWFWLRGMAGDGRRFWWGYWATVTVAMYTHLLMILLIPVHVIWTLIAWPQGRSQRGCPICPWSSGNGRCWFRLRA